MNDLQLKNIDPEDLGDLLTKIEKSFVIKFGLNEFEHISTFGEFCDHIASKIQLEDSDDCTTQQAFYKLRSAISSSLHLDKKAILPSHTLIDLLPRKGRRLRVRKIEKHLGFRIDILRPPHWVIGVLAITFIASLIELYFNWQIGITGMVLSFAGGWLANKIGNELDAKTVGQVAKKMAREHYLISRRNPNTYNKMEIETILIDWFSSEFDLEKNQLTREAKFV